MIMRFFLAALGAGLLVGVVMTPIQYLGVVPLIVHAETYEDGAGGHNHAHTTGLIAPAEAQERGAASGLSGGKIILAHSVTAAGGEDEAGAALFESRLAGTLAANIVTGVGFALMLGAASLLVGRSITASNGALWGLAGFAVVALAPALGLPPELPAMPAADLFQRQIWWVATVLLAAGALYLLVFRREVAARVAAVAMLAVPHLIGAPHPADLSSPVPPTLAAEFAVASLATAAVFWVLLGLGIGTALDRSGARAA